MGEVYVPEVQEIVQRLKAEGWQEREAGMRCENGVLETQLLRGGRILRVEQDLVPDVETVQRGWGEAKALEQMG